MYTIEIRFYEELNDFLDPEMRKKPFSYNITRKASIKDIIEALGVPHTEVDLILSNGQSVDFNYIPKENDLISIYPTFEALDISQVTHLRPKPLREPTFILDVHLGKLARYLRLFGFDTVYNNSFLDDEIMEQGIKEKRIILTRDVNLLKNKTITHGYWMRNTNPYKQLKEVFLRFELISNILPFTRCLECNGLLSNVDKNKILSHLPEKIAKFFNEYHECLKCHKIYWAGSHYDNLKLFLENFIKELF